MLEASRGADPGILRNHVELGLFGLAHFDARFGAAIYGQVRVAAAGRRFPVP